MNRTKNKTLPLETTLFDLFIPQYPISAHLLPLHSKNNSLPIRNLFFHSYPISTLFSQLHNSCVFLKSFVLQ